MKKITLLIMTICLCVSMSAFATDGTWNNSAGGDWEIATNWVGDTIADGAGATATFSIDTGAVSVDASRTVGVFNASAPAGFWVTDGPLVLDGGTPAIDVSGGAIYMNCALAGSSGFNKTSAGWLLLYNTTISGDINVNAGVLGLMWADSIMNADVKVNSGGTLLINNGVSANGKSVTVNSGGELRPYAGTASLNAPLTCNYADAGNTFSVRAEAANDTINLNSNITMTANTVMAVDANGSTININAPVSGAYQLRLLGRSVTASIGVYNINAACTYTGNTILESWGANPRFEMGVNNALPCNGDSAEVKLQVDNSSADTSVTLDLNGTTQKVAKLTFSIDGSQSGHEAIITGSDAGVIEVTNTLWSTAVAGTQIKLTGGKLINNAPGYSICVPMIITNATLIQNGDWWGGAGANFVLQNGAKVGGTGFLAWTGGASTDLVITAGATITPGNSIGTVGCWNLEMQDGSEYDWEVGTAAADMIDVRGDLDISDGGITVNVIDAGSPNGTYTLFAVTGSIVGDPTTDITMNYTGGLTGSGAYRSGNNIVADVVPEPATLGLLALLGLAILRRK